MTEPVNDAVFDFPATRQRAFMDGEALKRNKEDRAFHSELLIPSHLFPDEFPYDLDSPDSFASSLCSAVDSTDSTECESCDQDEDEDEFLAQLTRRLTQKLAVPSLNHDKSEKSCMASSPQSTLGGLGGWSASGNGSPNGPSQVPSPPTSPFGGQNDTWNLIYPAAGQVARLNMSVESPELVKNPSGSLSQTHRPVNSLSSCISSRQSSAHNNLPQPAETNKLYHQHVKREQRLRATNWQIQKKENRSAGENGRSVGKSSWPALPVQFQNRPAQPAVRSVFLAGSAAVKRDSAGTGVFLPRRYGNLPEFRKKPVQLPAKVVQALNLNLYEINGHPQANYSSNLTSSYDGLMTRRNVAVTQSKRSYSYRPEEIRLPHEWTY